MSKRGGVGVVGIDWVIFFAYLALMVIGLMMIYSTTYYDYQDVSIWDPNNPYGRQLMWAGISLLLLIIATTIDWKIWNTISLPLYGIGIVTLLLLLFVGKEVKGATSWLSVGPFSIQPSEFAKISTALYISSLFSTIRFDLKELRSQLLAVGIIGVPMILIILQPDPGSAITFASLFILFYRRGMPAMYFVVAIALFLTLLVALLYGFYMASFAIFFVAMLVLMDFNKKKLVSILLAITLLLTGIICYRYEVSEYAWLAVALAVSYYLFIENRKRSMLSKISFLGALLLLCGIAFSSDFAFNNLLKPHQQDRINVWLQPEKCDPRGSLYNLLQSKLAIGSGGITGKGYLDGVFTKLNYVPEQTTDFIFSSVGEEQGFLGGAAVIILFTILIVRLVLRGEASKHPFVKNFSYALAGFLFLHFFINIGMTMGITPVIGIPLPFISKGGSSLMAFSIMIGIALNMYRSKR